jgi:DNA-binding transcriptional LysR family regulator
MHTMHVEDLDLTQIRLLAALADTRQLSTAAVRIGLSQSAASHALAKLRRHSGDALIVRVANGLSPTPYGERLANSAREAILLLRDGLDANLKFDPTNTTRQFTVFLSDVGQMVLLPKLLTFMKQNAPNATLRACPVPLERPDAALSSGEVDLAVGYFTTLVSGFRHTFLFRESYSCVVRADHPDFTAGMNLDVFRAAPRAMADATGMSHAVMEHQLARHGVRGTPKLRVPQFMVLPLLIAKSDLLVVMPTRLAETFASFVPLKVMVPPVPLPEFDIAAYWHERFHDDTANQWFRRVFVRLFRGRQNSRLADFFSS